MTSGEKNRTSDKSRMRTLLQEFAVNFKKRPYVLFRAVLMLVAFLLITGNWYFFDKQNNFSIGSPAAKTYFALTSTRYEDKAATLELRQRAAARIAEVMVKDERASAEVEKKLNAIKEGKIGEVVSQPLLKLYAGLPGKSKEGIIRAVNEIGFKIKDSSLDREQQTKMIWQNLSEYKMSQSEKNVVFQILDAVLTPTLQTDKEIAERLRDDVATQIPPVIREIHTGSVLVQKGQLITPALAKLLIAQGYPDAGFPFKHLIFVLVIIFAWSMWPVWIESGLKEKLSYIEWIYVAAVLSLSWTLEVAFSRLGGMSMGVIGITGWLCLTLPVSLSYHIILGGGIVSILIAFGANPGVAALGCFLAIFSASIGRFLFIDPPSDRVTVWRNLFVLGLILGAIAIFVQWGLGIYFSYNLVLISLLFSAVWSTIVVAALPLWEYFFDVLSPLRLLELSHPSQPLLKRMQIEAPGTYHHILMVGTLAEAAADKLKLNSLLVKAGAYYHDIGKLKNPRFFVENQLRGDNIHDELSPTLSALVIISHVREGLEIAEEVKLPKSLRRFITEHHGTTLQRYFYRKARAHDDSVSEEQFRYPGPSPQSKETALVMMADSVEAAVKARGKPFDSVRDIQILVNGVINSKIEEEQLRDVDFTMRDITVIKECFVDIIRSMYHSREVKEIVSSKAIRNAGHSEKKEQGERT